MSHYYYEYYYPAVYAQANRPQAPPSTASRAPTAQQPKKQASSSDSTGRIKHAKYNRTGESVTDINNLPVAFDIVSCASVASPGGSTVVEDNSLRKKNMTAESIADIRKLPDFFANNERRKNLTAEAIQDINQLPDCFTSSGASHKKNLTAEQIEDINKLPNLFTDTAPAGKKNLTAESVADLGQLPECFTQGEAPRRRNLTTESIADIGQLPDLFSNANARKKFTAETIEDINQLPDLFTNSANANRKHLTAESIADIGQLPDQFTSSAPAGKRTLTAESIFDIARLPDCFTNANPRRNLTAESIQDINSLPDMFSNTKKNPQLSSGRSVANSAYAYNFAAPMFTNSAYSYMSPDGDPNIKHLCPVDVNFFLRHSNESTEESPKSNKVIQPTTKGNKTVDEKHFMASVVVEQETPKKQSDRSMKVNVKKVWTNPRLRNMNISDTMLEHMNLPDVFVMKEVPPLKSPVPPPTETINKRVRQSEESMADIHNLDASFVTRYPKKQDKSRRKKSSSSILSRSSEDFGLTMIRDYSRDSLEDLFSIPDIQQQCAEDVQSKFPSTIRAPREAVI